MGHVKSYIPTSVFTMINCSALFLVPSYLPLYLGDLPLTFGFQIFTNSLKKMKPSILHYFFFFFFVLIYFLVSIIHSSFQHYSRVQVDTKSLPFIWVYITV